MGNARQMDEVADWWGICRPFASLCRIATIPGDPVLIDV
jgi:hypothetical protein